MKLPVIYVAGPYRSQTREGVEMNIQAARHVAALCCRKGWSVICPHSNTSHLDAVVPNVDDQFWLDTTMELLRRCDAVVLVPGWQHSSGTLAEIAEAERLELSVYYSESELPTVSEFDRITAIMEKRPDFAQHHDAKCFVQNPSGTWFKNTLTDNVWPDETWEAWFSDLKDPDGWVEINEGTVLGDWKDTLVKRPETMTTDVSQEDLARLADSSMEAVATANPARASFSEVLDQNDSRELPPSSDKRKCHKCNGLGHHPSVMSPGLRQPPNIPCERCNGSKFEPFVSVEDGGAA